MVSELFDPGRWQGVEGLRLTDVTYHQSLDGRTVRIAIDRPDVRNAFRPETVDDLVRALDHARTSSRVGCVLLTGNGPSPRDGVWAFSSGGDQRIRGPDGYGYAEPTRPRTTPMAHPEGGAQPAMSEASAASGKASAARGEASAASGDSPTARGESPAEASPRSVSPEERTDAVDGGSPRRPEAIGRLHILEVQRLIRFMPKVVIAVVPGWAVGGGHSLHVVCDLTLASREHARFKQTDPDVASFDSGYGSALLARQVGQKFAREIFFLGRVYSAEQAKSMGMVNEVVTHHELESTALEWAATINSKSPSAMRMLKYGMNLPDDGLVGQQLFAGEATRLAYATEEAREGRDAFLEKRRPDFGAFPWHY